MRFKSAGVVGLAVGVLVISPHAQAKEILTFNYSIPSTPTNMVSPLPIQRFNPSLGRLESVSISLWGRVDGQVRFESLNATPRTVSYTLSANITLSDELHRPLAASLPVFTSSEIVPLFDGSLDYGGNSGRTYAGLTALASAPLSTFFDADALNRFTGSGALDFLVSGTGTSHGTGPGNIVWDIQTLASAWVQVDFVYQGIPEPACAALLALAGAACRRRPRALRRTDSARRAALGA